MTASTRRDLLRCVLATLAAGCTGSGTASQSHDAPPEITPQVVLIVQDGPRGTLSLYDDGWATLTTHGGAFMDERDYEGSDRVSFVGVDVVARIRELAADPRLPLDDAAYVQPQLHDAAAARYLVQSPKRRFTVIGAPELPASVSALHVEATAVAARIGVEGLDPFTDATLPARARILVRYDWWREVGGACRLTVFDDGLVEYRVLSSPASGDVRREGNTATMRAGPRTLAFVRRMVLSPRADELLFLHRGSPDRPGDSHLFHLPNVRAFRYHGAALEPVLQQLIDTTKPWIVELDARA